MAYSKKTSSLGAVLKRRAPLIVVLGSLVIAAGLIASRPKDIQTDAPERAWVVDTAEVSKAPRQPNIELYGKVQSPQDTKLRAGIEAEVLSVPVNEGDTVTRGQLLVLLDNRDAILDLREREAEVAELRAQVQLGKTRLKSSELALQKENELLKITESQSARAQELAAEGLLSKSDLDTSMETLKRQQLNINQSKLTVEENRINITQLEAQMMRATAQRDSAELAFQRTQIVAPFDGVLSEFNVSVGDRIGRGDDLMRLQNPAATEIRAQIPTSYAASVRNGLSDGVPLSVVVNHQGISVDAKLLRVAGQTRQNSGGVDAFIGFADGAAVAGDLRLGSTVRVLLELPPEANVFAVPAEAVYGRDRIYTSQDSRMKSVVVERVGERIADNGKSLVLLRSPDIADGTKVVVTKLSNAADGLLIESAGNAVDDDRTMSVALDATVNNPNSQTATR